MWKSRIQCSRYVEGVTTMPLWVPQKGRLKVEHNTGAVGATTIGTAVTTGTPASTKGTAVQLIAATAFESYWMTVIASEYAQSAAASEGCLDILIGAATEEILIPNLLMGYCGGGGVGVGDAPNMPKIWMFPLYTPAGSRLAARAAGARLSTAMRVAIYLYGGNGMPPFRVGTQVTTYGVTTVPNGVTITPGESGAEGAWTQITASTTRDHFAIVPSFQVSADAAIGVRRLAVDIGIGAATEKMIAESYWFQTDATEYMGGPWNTMPTFQDIPSGTRLTMRASNSGLNDGAYNGALHCVS